jgi:zinc protease
MYGSTLAVGGAVRDVENWPARIDAVTLADVTAVAKKRLLPRIAVTGYLLKEEAA